MDLGSRIANLRKEKGWTQNDLADKVFVTDKTVSSWEINRTEPSLETLIKLSELFSCSISYLIYGDTERSDIETEIKIRLSKDEFENIELFMKKCSVFLSENTQIDTYYQPTYRKFLKEDNESIDEWLRIGVRGNKKIINYKKWYENKYCDEYEVEVDDENNLDQIFKVLGLEKIAIVNKVRKSYLYLNKYEIALDYVQDLGYFIEIEVKKYDTSIMEEYDELLKFAKRLNLNLDHLDKRGYPYHLIYGSK